jgi:zinc/manganese transport system ATP-binding protein
MRERSGRGGEPGEHIAAIDVHEGGISLGGRVVWTDLDVHVPAGEFVAVLGPNGVGKSTLLRVVLGLQPLSGGTVRVFGRPPHEARELIGYLPQRRIFDTSLRVRGMDIVRLGADGARWGVPLSRTGRHRVREAVDEAIEEVGASPYAHRPIGEISGGEQQRLLIAQALVRRPWMVLLDEPLDSLDLPNQAMVAKLVAELCREAGITVVLVAHDVNPILPYVDRVVYLGQGGAATGPPDQVITSETLTSLYRTPIEVLRASDGRLVVVGQPEAPAHHHDRHAS